MGKKHPENCFVCMPKTKGLPEKKRRSRKRSKVKEDAVASYTGGRVDARAKLPLGREDSPYVAQGVEQIATLSLDHSTATRYSVVTNLPLAPGTIGSRLPVVNTLFEKYRVDYIDLVCTIIGSATDDIEVMVGVKMDVADDPPTADSAGLGAMMSWPHHVAVSRGMGRVRLHVVPRMPSGGYFTNEHSTSDPRLAYIGRFVMMVRLPSSAADYNISVEAHYKIVFFEPTVDTPDTAYSGRFLTGDVGQPDPTPGKGWNWVSVESGLKLLEDVTGVHVFRDASNNVTLHLPPGLWDLVQMYLPETSPVSGHVHYFTPLLVDGYAAISMAETVLSAAAGVLSYRKDRISVPYGSFADLHGTFEQTGTYVETNNPLLQFALSAVS